ncbi:hypothetical protein CFOL_v3_29140 [Cephalotus follicularis]|uniref:Uncharacterized protein n=1 Tax=Cephalotus follicularis TaxID=3775 RepID=A0A1Q3CZN0_CEPFO|nr:hypothetical protein CFOL_v3_29140 [Cephalotus follicularis]
MQWVPQESDIPITYATYSCDCQSVYVSLRNGCIKVLDNPTFNLRCQINLTAYALTSACLELYPLVIAAHPSEPNQIALGLTNGRVLVLEPVEFGGEWGLPPPPSEVDDGISQVLVPLLQDRRNFCVDQVYIDQVDRKKNKKRRQ